MEACYVLLLTTIPHFSDKTRGPSEIFPGSLRAYEMVGGDLEGGTFLLITKLITNQIHHKSLLVTVKDAAKKPSASSKNFRMPFRV
jgi:hypothetical protein